MKKRVTPWLICFLMVFTLLPVTAHADMGPKPSVRITFENMGDEVCYGTLLSKTDSTGPSSAWDGNPEDIRNYNMDLEIWQAFVDYDDADGYYFLQEGWLCSESKQLDWTYYPPSSFKILLYYPDLGVYVVSDIYERYAFDSYFTVNMEGTEIGSVNASITAQKSYDYAQEIISLVCRVVLTILLEVGIAWLFGFRQKKLIQIILCVNVVTQLLLNVLLNIAGYYRGPWAFIVYYVLLELIVFAVEAVLYRKLLRRDAEQKISGSRCVVYALVANAVSFAAGYWISLWIPDIF